MPSLNAPDGASLSTPGGRNAAIRGGVFAVAIASVIVGWGTVWGQRVQTNPDVKLGAAPLVGQWKFRPSIGYLMPISLALLIVAVVPRLFERLRTRWVVLSTVGLTAAFTAALAGSNGRVDMLAPVVHRSEYLFWLEKMPPARQMLADYDQYDFIVNFGTHIKGHPPGYMLLLKTLAALGLAKPWIIASLSYLSAGVVAGSVLVVARRFGTPKFTRMAAPFLMLAPYAVWMGTSADALFSALVALSAAALATAPTVLSTASVSKLTLPSASPVASASASASRSSVNRFLAHSFFSNGFFARIFSSRGSSAEGYRPRFSKPVYRQNTYSLLAGVSIGAGLYSSWGTLTCGPIMAGVLWCKSGHSSVRERIPRAFGVAVWVFAGVLVIAATMTSLGYNWFAGMGLTRRLYWKGTAQFRPWKYFLVGNLATLLIAIGVVAIVGVGVGLGVSSFERSQPESRFAMVNAIGWLRVLVVCALIGVLAADLSQYSKGEVERIWLPFMPWLTLPVAFLARQRFWLLLQATSAIGLQVMLISKW
jgi:methylthioxylose transferase